MKRNIIATNEWFKGRHLLKEGSCWSLAVYMILQKMQQMDGKILVSIGELITYMMADRKSEIIVRYVKESIAFLVQEEFIILYEDIHMTKSIKCDLKNAKTGQVLYIKIGELPKTNYTQITIDELNIVMGNQELKVKQKVQILCYFMALVMHIDNDSKVAFPSLKVLRDMLCIRKEKCEKFNEMLKEQGLIIYSNAGALRIEGEGYVSNTYARAEHKLELEAEIKRLQQTHRRNYSQLEKYQKADMKRSLKQKINVLQHKIEKVGELTVKEQREFEKLQRQYNQLLDIRSVE